MSQLTVMNIINIINTIVVIIIIIINNNNNRSWRANICQSKTQEILSRTEAKHMPQFYLISQSTTRACNAK